MRQFIAGVSHCDSKCSYSRPASRGPAGTLRETRPKAYRFSGGGSAASRAASRASSPGLSGGGLPASGAGLRTPPDMEPEGQSAAKQHQRWDQPERERLTLEPRLQQHELAVARDQEIDHLWIAVAGRDALAHQQPKIARQWRLGIVDRLVLTDHAAQFPRQLPRARFLGGIGHHLVGQHGARGRKPEQGQAARSDARTRLIALLRRLQAA